MDFRNITEREKDLLLTHFFHYLAMDAHSLAGKNSRGVIMREYPGIYNRLIAREIMKVEVGHAA